MLLGPVSARQAIPPGFIDFASSSFDAILHHDASTPASTEPPPPHGLRRRSSHLPDLLPFISLVTEKCDIQPVHLVMALIYVQRFRATLPSNYKAEPEAAHRIFAASLLLASKYNDDHCLSTKKLIRATGDVWSIKEMTRMELAFLRFLKWDLHIHPDELDAFLKQFHFEHIALIFPDSTR
ncbi:cyclin-like protein [Syncephalastrum racemosum]|uniref:Cyclin-like protein n=1 Tax=Syncephalastrum racemosum TaxID=13706 RepID=A0A1X2H554_SYNRA|nr:cyclin-like protein [Syncephalastrum racemosum]